MVLHRKKIRGAVVNLSAERQGFEPWVPEGTTVFETAPIDHSGIFPFVSAERTGFEPVKHFRRLHAFQACLFNHSSTFPYLKKWGKGRKNFPKKVAD